MMTTYQTLVDALKANQYNPQSLTFISGNQQQNTSSYAQLYQRALGVLHNFQQYGINPNAKLILFLEDNNQFIDAFWASLLGKIIPVPISAGNAEQHRHKLFNVFRKLDNAYLYTTKKQMTRLAQHAAQQQLDLEFAKLEQHTFLVEDITDIATLGQEQTISADDVAFIQFSSGSTGQPKGVVLTHRNLMANINAIIAAAEFTTNDICFSWMPLTHDMGLIGFHFTPLVFNISQYIMPTELFIRRPKLWLQQVSETKATMISSPNFGYRYVLKHCDLDQLELDLSSVRLIYNGAEPISATLCREFMGRFKQFGLHENTMFPVYGMAEASLAVTFPQPGASLKSVNVARHSLVVGQDIEFAAENAADAIELTLLGSTIENCQLRIVDDQDNELAENQFGHVQIRGENVTNGYLDDASLNAKSFTSDGWLATYDLGFMFDGQLVVTGRSNDLIIIHGNNHYPHDIESAISAAHLVELGKVAACSVRAQDDATDKLAVFMTHRGELNDMIENVKAIKELISNKFALAVDYVLPVARIPKTSSGKLQRYLLAKQFAAGDFNEMARQLQQLLMQNNQPDITTDNVIEKNLQIICNNHLEQAVTVNDNLLETGTSSLTLVQIYEEIDQKYPDLIEITDIFDYPTIVDLAELIKVKMA